MNCALLGEPDGHGEQPDSKFRVTVTVHLRGIEAQRFMVAEPGDPEHSELVNVSTTETFSPYGVDCVEDLPGCSASAQHFGADTTAL